MHIPRQVYHAQSLPTEWVEGSFPARGAAGARQRAQGKRGRGVHLEGGVEDMDGVDDMDDMDGMDGGSLHPLLIRPRRCSRRGTGKGGFETRPYETRPYGRERALRG